MEHIGTPLQLFQSYTYLSYRTQRVKVGDSLSEEVLECWIPQGTVLGSLLFIVYIDDISKIDTSDTILSYADDTTLLYKSK